VNIVSLQVLLAVILSVSWQFSITSIEVNIFVVLALGRRLCAFASYSNWPVLASISAEHTAVTAGFAAALLDHAGI
jgi:hypothetical protein